MSIDTILIVSAVLISSDKIHDNYGLLVAGLSLSILTHILRAEDIITDVNAVHILSLIPYSLIAFGLFAEFLPAHYILIPIVYIFICILTYYSTAYKITIERIR